MFFMHQFIAERKTKDGNNTMNDGKYLATNKHELQDFLSGLKKSNDKWIATCGVFLKLAKHFLELVNAYRIGDAIAIEYGHAKYSTVWGALGQNKYVEIVLGQQETLYHKFPFSRLQELRINCVVRHHRGATGKRCIAHDDFL